MRAKLGREMGGLLKRRALFCHTLTETIAWEGELRRSRQLPPGVSGALQAFYSTAAPMEAWLDVEHADAIANFEELASVPANWRVNASSQPSTWRTDDGASTWRTDDGGAEVRHVDGGADLAADETTADVPPIAAGVTKARPS